MVKNFEDIFIRFGATPERDGQTDRRTDRRTDGHRVTAYTALMHMHRAVKKIVRTRKTAGQLHDADATSHDNFTRTTSSFHLHRLHRPSTTTFFSFARGSKPTFFYKLFQSQTSHTQLSDLPLRLRPTLNFLCSSLLCFILFSWFSLINRLINQPVSV